MPWPLAQTGSAESAGATAHPCSLSAPAAAGSLLVAMLGVDKSSGAITVPEGFTLIAADSTADTSGAIAFRIAAGGEQGATWGTATARDAAAVLLEYAVNGAEIDVWASEVSTGPTVTAKSSGTTAPTSEADTLAVACWSIDTGSNADAGRTYSNGFVERAFPSTGTRPGLAVADSVRAAIGPVECTFAAADNGDQMNGFVAVFRAAAGPAAADLAGAAEATAEASGTLFAPAPGAVSLAAAADAGSEAAGTLSAPPPAPPPGARSHFRLTVFGDDDATVLATCSTDPADPRPWLMWPDQLAESEVDLAEGRSVIGQANVRVLDRRTDPADQASGWLTALLADAGGESALNGRRALLEQRDGGPFFAVLDGVLGGVSLDDSLVVFALQLRDIRERERKARAFVRSGTATVLPRGTVTGWGRLPGGAWLVPPATPLVGRFDAAPNGLEGLVLLDLSSADVRKKKRPVDPRIVLTEAMRSAARLEWVAFPDGGGTYVAPDVAVLWRPEGSAVAWTELRQMQVGGGIVFHERGSTFRDAEGKERDVPHVSQVALGRTTTGGVPAAGQRVELLVRFDGAPSAAYPLHLEQTAGELLRDLYRGDHSDAAPRTRVDEAALLALDTPIRARITETVEDVREWAEKHVYRPLGAAPALDAAGRIAPIRYRLPDEGVALPQLDDTNSASATWEHPTGDAINVVRTTYRRDYRVPAEADPLGERSAGDGIAEREVTVERRNARSVELLGEQELEVDASLFRALGGAEGQPLSGEAIDETAHQLALERGEQALDRFVLGGQTVRVRCRRSATAALRVGDWVLLAHSWTPEYTTGRRGSNRLAQIVAAKDLNPAWREFRLLDAGAANQPLAQPTLGAPSADADGVVAVAVTAVPAGGEARCSYAVSPTVPAAASPLWTYLGRTDAPATLRTPPQPAGATVWIRGRGEGRGRRPSAWTNPVSLAIPQTPRLADVGVFVDPDTGDVAATWTPNPYARGVRIRPAAHDPGADPAFGPAQEFDAVAGFAAVALAVTPGQTVTLEVEPWSGWTGAAVSGSAGPLVRASRATPAVSAAALRVRLRVEVFEMGGSTGTLRLIVEDPDGTVQQVQFYATGGDGVRSGPFAATRAPGGGVYERDIALHPERSVTLEPIVTLLDGTLLQPGGEVFDRDRSPNILGRPTVDFDADQATVRVRADTDTASLWRQEWIGGAWGAETQFAAAREGSFVATASEGAQRRFRIYGKTSGGLAGDAVEVFVDRYRPPYAPPADPRGYVNIVDFRGRALLRVQSPVGGGASFRYKASTAGQPTDTAGSTLVNFDAGRLATPDLGEIPGGGTMYATVWFYEGVGASGVQGEVHKVEQRISTPDAIDPGSGLLKPDAPLFHPTNPAGQGGLFLKPAPSDPDTLDSIPDGGTYGRPLSTYLASGRVTKLRDEAAGVDYPGSSVRDGAERARSGLESGGYLVDQRNALTRLAGRTLDNIADTATYRRAGTGYVDSSGRVSGLYDPAVGFRDGGQIGTGVSRANANLDPDGLKASVNLGGVPVSRIRDQAQSPTQNLLGPDAGPGYDGVSELYLHTYVNGPIAALGLVPGAVISVGLEAYQNGAATASVGLLLDMRDAAGALVFSQSALTSAGSFTRVGLEGITIPATAATMFLVAYNPNTGTAQRKFVQRAMLNRGPVALAFEEPPFRAQREDAGAIRDGYGRTVKEKVGLVGQNYHRTGPSVNLRVTGSAGNYTISWDATSYANGPTQINVAAGSVGGLGYNQTRHLYYDGTTGTTQLTTSIYVANDWNNMALGTIKTPASSGESNPPPDPGDGTLRPAV